MPRNLARESFAARLFGEDGYAGRGALAARFFGEDSFAGLRLPALGGAAVGQTAHQAFAEKNLTAFSGLPVGGVGDLKPPVNYQPVESAWNIPGPNALIDVYTADENTTGTLVVDGAHVIAASDTPGDNDWFAVTLTAGVTYEFGQYAYAGHVPGVEGNGVPLADAFLELYDDDGNLLSLADGGGPNTPSGLDALMTFEAPYSGTFYVNATSYDNDGDGVGDFVGDYELFARTATGTVYTSEYDISSPLHSIDWGGVRVNREHVAVENPDGAEGPRPTGDPAADPGDVEGNALGFPGKNVIYLYFAGTGDVYAHQDSTIPAQVVVQDPYQYEVQAMLTAANEFSKVADVVFVSNYTFNPTTRLYERDETIEYKPGPLGPQAGIDYAAGVDDGFDADFFYFSYPGTPGPVISLLGSMNPPDYGDEGVAQFNSADERWNAQMLQPGGFSFVTLIHEFGHGMGLAHPHDTGGGSSVMPGVNPLLPGDDGGAGTHKLNQGVFTMMSYNDGWEESPYGQAETNNEGYGWLGSLMALDIAVIQDKYGVNEEWATGNNTYVLKDVNQWGVYIDSATGQPAQHDATNAATTRDGFYQGQSTYYSSIWDAGGVDQITYSGSRNTTIDLRAATLQYEIGGGGRMSYATGIYGGFTIANGVTIENARGGSGNDTLIGNDVANILVGGVGADAMTGGGGNDTYYADNSGDTATENADEGTDHVLSSATFTLGENVETLTLTGTAHINGTGSSGANTIIGNPGNNRLDGAGGADVMKGRAGNDTYIIDNAGDRIEEAAGQGTDQVLASASHTLSNEVENLTLTGAENIDGTGNGGANLIIGNAANNVLNGMGGADLMKGRAGDDTYHVDNAGDYADEAFNQGTDSVFASVSFTLDGDVENLTLTGAAATNGTGTVYANVLTGNAGANSLWGLGSNDTLDGGGGNDSLYGGTGQDSLTGGAGLDGFYFDSSLGAANADQIQDYSSVQDTIYLDDAVFTAIGIGTLGANAFVIGTAASDADDRIVYNQATGQIFYDPDGAGGSAALLFASVDPGTILTNTDFIVY